MVEREGQGDPESQGDDSLSSEEICRRAPDARTQPERVEGFSGSKLDWQLVKHSNDIIAILDLDGTIIFASPSAERVLGRSLKDELVGFNAFQYVHSEDLEMVTDSFSRCSSSPETILAPTFRFLHGDGSWIFLEAKGTNLVDDPTIKGIVVNLRDVTERTISEEKLSYRLDFEYLITRISNSFIITPFEELDNAIMNALERIGRFTDSDRAYIFLFNKDGRTMSNTHEWCAKGTLPQKDDLQELPCDTFPWWIRNLREEKWIVVPRVSDLPSEASAERNILEEQNIQSLIILPLISTGALLGYVGFDSVRQQREWDADASSLLLIVGEILANALARARSENEARRRELILRAIGGATEQFLKWADWECVIPLVLSNIGTAFGISRARAFQISIEDEEIYAIEKHVWRSPRLLASQISKEARPLRIAITAEMNSDFNRMIDHSGAFYGTHSDIGGAFSSFMEAQGIKSILMLPTFLGSERWGFLSIEDCYEEHEWSGMEIDALKILADALGAAMLRKKAETIIREERDLLGITLKTIIDGVIVVDREWRVRVINAMAEKILHVSQEDVLTKPLFELGGLAEVMGNQLSEESGQHQTDFLSELSSSCTIEGTMTVIRGPEENLVGRTIAFRDITEKKKMEENMERSARMESIGFLAGGIAHDFNNMLTTNLGNISLAKTMVGDGSEIRHRLEAAELAASNARDLTKQLLIFSRGGNPVKKELDPGPLLRETAKIVLSGSSNTFKLDVDEDIWPVEVDRALISQAIINLTLNAMEAMPGGGEVLIGAQNVFIGASQELDIAPGKYVKIDVIDSGCGIEENQIVKIFDPYYSTKNEKAGLGLSICHSIISKHQGTIDVTSRPGKGTAFHLYLPAAGIQARKENEKIENKSSMGRILVMDDEELILEVAREMISRLGYGVDTAPDGRSAIEMYVDAKKSGNCYDAVIMDLTIRGGMGGRDAVKELLNYDPHAKVIVSSGYSDDAIMSRYMDYGFKDVMPKPYDLNDLGEKLSKVIGNEYS
jgi:PAS domain S-box-containing protein